MTQASTTLMLRIIRAEWFPNMYHKRCFGHPHGDEMIHKIGDGPVSNSFSSFTCIGERHVMNDIVSLQVSIRAVEL
jgi:hypothetical protein